jgi:Fe2+ transport system protein FeoA
LFEKISNYLLQPLSGLVLEGTLMQATQNIITLADLKSGESATINSLKAGRNINARLSTLGFTPGVLIFMTHNYGHGPIVVTVRDTRIALGRGEAEMIFVKRERE